MRVAGISGIRYNNYMHRQVTDYTLYRWRYGIAYCFATIAVVAAVLVAGLFIPGEIRSGEIESSITSSELSFQNLTPVMIVGSPYYILQKVSFILLGVTPLSIKLPSMILALATALGLLLLFRAWFTRSIAIITILLVALSAQFLFLAQDGTPSIAFSCLTVWLLYAATQAVRTKKMSSTLWKVVACVLAALLLYIPLGIYVVAALGVLAIFHPHARYTVLRVQRTRLFAAVLVGGIALLPLIYAILTDHTVAKQLLGLPLQAVDVAANVKQLIIALFGATAPGTSYLVQPLHSIGMVLMMIIGFGYLINHYYTARSYALLLIGLSLFGIVIINPERITALFPASAILVAFSVAWLVNHWYSMFPRNPYARVTGLLPIVVLISGLAFAGINRYIETYRYNPEILAHYSSDLQLITNRLQRQDVRPDQPLLLAVTDNEHLLYHITARYNDRLRVTTAVPKGQKFLATRAFRRQHSLGQPSDIIANARSVDSDRFYGYSQTP